MKKIFLILTILIFNLTYSQQRTSIYFHIIGKVYNATELVSKDGTIYKALSQTNDTPPSVNWEAVGTGSGTASPLTTKGDIYTFTTDNARLNVGVNGQVLTVNSTTPTGIEWATVSGSGDVLKVGTPADRQVGVWTGDGTIEGDTDFTFDGTNLTVTGNVLGGNLAISNWNLAYGWGDHSTQGYITNGQETDQVYVASQASNIDAGDITNLGNLSGVNTGDQNLNDHFAITGNYETLLSDKDRKGLITSGVNITLNDFGTSTDAEFQMYLYNRSGTDVTFSLGTSPQQYTDQYGTGVIPNLPDNAYVYLELVADNVWSLVIGGLTSSGGTGAVTSVNGMAGIVVIDPDDLDDTSTTNKFVTATDIDDIRNELSKKDLTTLSEASYTTTLADKGAYITITSGDITLAKSGLPDGFNQIFYNASGADINLVGDAVTGVNNAIPSGYFATVILDGTTWRVSTPSSGGGTASVESVNTKTGVVVLDTDDISEGTNKYNVSHTGDVTGATTLTIGNDKVVESMLKSVNAPTDEYVLTYEATTGDFEWQAEAAGGATNLGYIASATDGTVTTDTGTENATIPLATTTNAGLLSPSEKVQIPLFANEEPNLAKLDANNVFTGTSNTFKSIFGDYMYLGSNTNNLSGYLQIESGEGNIVQLIWSNVLSSFMFSATPISFNRSILQIDDINTDGKSLITKEWALDKINAAGGGNVSNIGTPLNDQLAVWTTGTTIEGTNDLRFSLGTLSVPNITANGNILTTSEMRFSSSNQIPQGEIFYDATLNGIKVQGDNELQLSSPTVSTNAALVNDINFYTLGTSGLNIDSAGRMFATGNSELAITSESSTSKIAITKEYAELNYNNEVVDDLSPQLGGNLDLNTYSIGDDVNTNLISTSTSPTFPTTIHTITAPNNVSGHVLNSDGTLYDNGSQVVIVSAAENLYSTIHSISEVTTSANHATEYANNNYYYECNSPTGISITLNSGVAKRRIIYEQTGAGKITFTAGTGVTIHTPETLISNKQYSTVIAIYKTSTLVVLSGDLEKL